MELQLIQNKIFEVRGLRVMLDFDLAGIFIIFILKLSGIPNYIMETIRATVQSIFPIIYRKLVSFSI